MNNLKNKKYYLILGNFTYLYITLLFIVGVFLFPNTAYLSTISSEKIIELTNKERMDKDLSPLTANQYLTQAAHNKALDIFKNQRFEHNFEDRRFSAWIQDVNYKYKYVGENLAIDFVNSEGVVSAWIDSPTHYENLVNYRFSEIGVAVVEDIFKNENSIVVVQIFGTPLKNNPNLNSDIKNIANKNFKNNYLTNSTQDKLNIVFNENRFLDFNKNNKSEYLTIKNEKQKIPDLIFTLFGFIYLGVFKLVSIKNIGL
jgi:hypothetical protein